jgi:hypothetical protein
VGHLVKKYLVFLRIGRFIAVFTRAHYWILYYFTFGLRSEVASSSEYIASNGRITGNAEWERIWKEAVVEWLEVLSQQLPGGIEGNHKIRL